MVRLAQTHHAERAHSVLDSYMEVSICKEWMSLQEGLLLTQQVRILKSQRFVRRQKGYFKSTLRAEQHLWQSHAEQGRWVVPAVCVSALLPWGAMGQCQAGRRSSPCAAASAVDLHLLHLNRKPGGHSWFSLAGQREYSRMNLLQAVKCFSWSVW